MPPEVVAERYERLVALVDELAWAENRALVGNRVEVLVAAGEGRKDAVTQRLSGRARDNRLVHLASCDAEPGDFVTAEVTYAAPHHLVADDVVGVRRGRGATTVHSPTSVSLGMPVVLR